MRERVFCPAAPYSLACDVQGEMVCVNSLEELRHTQISDKIVLLQGTLASEPLMPKSFVFWNPEEHKVCFSAHIDTKEGTPGALDNASGTAVLLALASELTGREYPYRIEFILFNGEDYYSNPGEMAYLASQLSRPEEFVCAYNIDGVGLKNQKLSYSFYEYPEKLINTIARFAANFSVLEKIEPWPQGDHMLFASSGVPAIAITSCKIFELVDSVLHTASDTLELVDIEILETLVHFLLYSI